MEAASIAPRRRRPKRRRSRAWLALLAYIALAAVAVWLVSGALDDGLPTVGGSDEPGQQGITFGPGSDELALRTVGSRAQRSTLGVDGATGFVGWEATGLTLVVTARPKSGWPKGSDRGVTVSYNGRSFPATLVRADPRTGLGLVRVKRVGIAKPLWDAPARTPVRRGELLAIVGRRSAKTVSVGRAGARRVYLDTGGLGPFVGSPVLDAEGRLVGVVDAGGAAVPIARACGVIRRC